MLMNYKVIDTGAANTAYYSVKKTKVGKRKNKQSAGGEKFQRAYVSCLYCRQKMRSYSVFHKLLAELRQK